MSMQDILNADMETLSEWIKSGFSWWLGELSAIMPKFWHNRFSSRTALTAESLGGGQYRFTKLGNEIAFSSKADGRRTPVTLVIPDSQVLQRTLDMPLLSAKDINRLIALDIDRLTPFSAESIYHNAYQVARDSDNGRQKIQLGVIVKTVADSAVELAAAHGLDVKCLTTAGTRLDFIPPMRASEGKDDEHKSRLIWWSSVAALLLINLAVLIFRDMHDINQLQTTIDGQSATANVGRQLRQRIEQDHAQREAVIARRAGQEPLKILSAVSQTLPDEAWVQRLTWNGQTIRLAGYKRSNIDMIAALSRSTMLKNVRPSTSDVVLKNNAGQPFDITADTKTPQNIKAGR